jgi:hypothetical protein
MVDGLKNPYRSDRVAEALFVGREALLAELAAAVRAGRNAVRAVMGGRGMGKSSLTKQLEFRLAGDALTVVTSGTAHKVASQIGGALGVDIAVIDPVEALVTAAKQHPKGRVAIVLDEIEKVLDDPDGFGLLDNLREAYERANGRLALLVLGGTAIRDLLEDKASPFLRIMGDRVHTLRGLELNEAAELIRAPLDLQVPDEVVDALWAETAGHPWLLQMFMEYAVDAAPSLTEVITHIPAALRRAEGRLDDAGFRLWWGNLRERGQVVYRRVVRQAAAVPRAQWVRCFGSDPRPWLDVLASTGIVLLDDEAVIARGTLFQRWVEQNCPETLPAKAPDPDPLEAWLTTVGVDAFEHLVVRALAVWARATVEFPAAALKQDAHTRTDNNGLAPEAFFQMHAIVALLQHERDVTAEPEALSMKPAGRSDIKVRSRHDPARRACVEFKIFGRNDAEVVKQVIGYAAPSDTFAAVVSVDRCRRPLRPVFEEGCFDGAAPEATHDAPATVFQPAFFTEHYRENCGPLRVWHFLVQLRDA